jgi:hypothetical protein
MLTGLGLNSECRQRTDHESSRNKLFAAVKYPGHQILIKKQGNKRTMSSRDNIDVWYSPRSQYRDRDRYSIVASSNHLTRRLFMACPVWLAEF